MCKKSVFIWQIIKFLNDLLEFFENLLEFFFQLEFFLALSFFRNVQKKPDLHTTTLIRTLKRTLACLFTNTYFRCLFTLFQFGSFGGNDVHWNFVGLYFGGCLCFDFEISTKVPTDIYRIDTIQRGNILLYLFTSC